MGVTTAIARSLVSTPISVSFLGFYLRNRETIAVEEPTSFFAILDATTESEGLSSLSSPKAIHEYAISTAISEGLLSQPGSLASVEMALALHTSSPKIEAFFQYYLDRQEPRRENMTEDNCESWVDWYGQIVCDLETLARYAGTETIESAIGTNV